MGLASDQEVEEFLRDKIDELEAILIKVFKEKDNIGFSDGNHRCVACRCLMTGKNHCENENCHRGQWRIYNAKQKVCMECEGPVTVYDVSHVSDDDDIMCESCDAQNA